MTAAELVEDSCEVNNDDGDGKPRETDKFIPASVEHEHIELAVTGTPGGDSKTDNVKDYSLCKRLGLDKPYRRRFIHTVWLFWAFIGLGWAVSQTGPSFPDLQQIVQQDLGVASWLFTSGSFGYMLGSLISGYLYDHFNKLLLIFFSVLILAIGTIALPWCSSFPLMIAVRVISGIGAGGLDTGGNADLVSLWDEEGRPFMQAMHFCFGFGGIISPMITEPFLAEKKCVPNQLENNTSLYLANNSSQTTMSMTIISSSSDTPQCVEEFGETHVHYAYIITGVLVLSGALPFFVMYLQSVWKRRDSHDMKADKGTQKRPEKLPFLLKITMLVFLVCFMTMYCAVEDTFGGFLMTFTLNHLNWTKEEGSYATSLHWFSFALGRFLGIFLIKKFRPVQMLFAYCIMLICAFIGFFAVSYTMTTDLVLVFVALAGFSMSIIFPCIFTWTEESILEVTGMISSMFLMAASTGLLLNPLFLGYLMDNYDPIAFAYILLGESITCLIFFLIIYFLVKKFVKSPTPRPLEIEITVNPLNDG